MNKLATAVGAVLILIFVIYVIGGNKPRMLDDMNLEREEITIVFFGFDTVRQMQAAVAERFDFDPPITLLGMAGWGLEPPYYCEVYYVRPKHVDDYNMLTIGHEVSHCIYGTFHPETIEFQ